APLPGTRREQPGRRPRQDQLARGPSRCSQLCSCQPRRCATTGGHMTFLANIPIWVYFIVLAVTFMVVHVLAIRANQPQNRARSIGGRVGSSLILLLALVFLNPADPGSVLLALF